MGVPETAPLATPPATLDDSCKSLALKQSPEMSFLTLHTHSVTLSYRMRSIEIEKSSDAEVAARYRARARFRAALSRGKISKSPCKVCGVELVEAHHPDLIAEPLRVEWLCKKHHREEENGKAHGEAPRWNIRVPKDWDLELRALVKRNGWNFSEILRDVIKKGLRPYGVKTE